MRTGKQLARLSILVLLLVPVTGCTLNAPGKPTLATTTSAEQTQRIFWDDVKAHKWTIVRSLLTANVAWRNGSQLLTRDDIVPYLKQLELKDYLITNLVVKANANDMTVLYDIQLSAGTSPQPVNLHALAIWQQLPLPPPDASKKEKKQASANPPYLLTLEDLSPDAPIH